MDPRQPLLSPWFTDNQGVRDDNIFCLPYDCDQKIVFDPTWIFRNWTNLEQEAFPNIECVFKTSSIIFLCCCLTLLPCQPPIYELVELIQRPPDMSTSTLFQPIHQRTRNLFLEYLAWVEKDVLYLSTSYSIVLSVSSAGLIFNSFFTSLSTSITYLLGQPSKCITKQLYSKFTNLSLFLTKVLQSLREGFK